MLRLLGQESLANKAASKSLLHVLALWSLWSERRVAKRCRRHEGERLMRPIRFIVGILALCVVAFAVAALAYDAGYSKGKAAKVEIIVDGHDMLCEPMGEKR
jgi:hypothetical protein